MLLDDVMSELDGERRELLTDVWRATAQTLITATESAHLPERASASRSGSAPAPSHRWRSRHEPPTGTALGRVARSHDVLETRAPKTLLAAVQSEWERAAGAAIAPRLNP